MENTLNPRQRQRLKIAVIIISLLFLLGYFFFLFSRHDTNEQQQNPDQVVFQQPLLQVFQYKETLNTYPDAIRIHYPYLLVVRPNEGTTQIYNLQQKTKDKKTNAVLLDYYEEIEIYNKAGKTYVDNTNLNVLCTLAFMKTKQDVLCVTKLDSNKPDVSLIEIDTNTLTQKILHTSHMLITAIYYANSTIYLGEYDPVIQKSFISTNNDTIPVPDWINIIYPMNSQIYLASFKSVRNNNKESYSLFQNNNINLITQGEIRF